MVMQKLSRVAIFIVSSWIFSISFAGSCGEKEPCPNKACDDDICCARMGGVGYCDSSAGRLVCRNGYYSSCYCTRHAIMDLQLLQGCCLWQNGVSSIDKLTGYVICNDGGISQECTLQNMPTINGNW